MTEDQLYEKCFKARFVAQLAVCYWGIYIGWYGLFWNVLRAILAVSAVLSSVGLLIAPQYQSFAAWVGCLTGLISAVIIPVFGWESLLEKLVYLRNSWIEVREGYESVLDSLDDIPLNQLMERYERWRQRDKQLEQETIGLPELKTFTNKADAQARTLYGN